MTFENFVARHFLLIIGSMQLFTALMIPVDSFSFFGKIFQVLLIVSAVPVIAKGTAEMAFEKMKAYLKQEQQNIQAETEA